MDTIDAILEILKTLGIIIGLYYLLLVFSLAVWTYRDIRSRTHDITAQVLAVAMVLVLHIPGALLYLLMRPKQTLTERYERALEEEYLRRDIEDDLVCPSCQRGAAPDFVVCPYCLTELRRRCHHCDRTVDLTWQVCPYCGTVAGSTDGEATVQMSNVPRARVYS